MDKVDFLSLFSQEIGVEPMAIIVEIPSIFRNLTHGASEVAVEATTIKEVVEQLIQRFPDLEKRLLEADGSLKPFVNLYLGDRNTRDLQGLDTPVSEGDRVAILPAIAGGVKSPSAKLPLALPFLLGVVLLICLPLQTGCRQASASNPSLRVGLYPNVTHTVGIVGLQKGVFQKAVGKEHPILYYLFNGGGEIITALTIGELDLAYVGPGPAVNGIAHGAPLRILAGASEGGFALVVPRDSPIRQVRDLSGKRVAVPTLAGTQDICLRHLLGENGLEDSAKGGTVHIFHATPSEIPSLFELKHIDAALVAEPLPSLLQYRFKARRLLEADQIWSQSSLPSTVLVVSEKALKEKSNLVRRFLNAHYAVTSWIQNHPQEALQEVHRFLKANHRKIAPEVLIQAFQHTHFTSHLSPRALQDFVDLMSACGYLPQDKRRLVLRAFLPSIPRG